MRSSADVGIHLDESDEPTVEVALRSEGDYPHLRIGGRVHGLTVHASCREQLRDVLSGLVRDLADALAQVEAQIATDEIAAGEVVEVSA